MVKAWVKAIAPMVLAVLCGACVSQKPAPSFDQVIGKNWKLIGIKVANTGTSFFRDTWGTDGKDFYTIKFQDTLVFGRAAPNNYRGPFELGQNQGIRFDSMAATQMALLNEPKELKENEYFKYLEEVYRWDIKDGNLELHSRNEKGEAIVLRYSE
jgi:heat shock protein HslJ